MCLILAFQRTSTIISPPSNEGYDSVDLTKFTPTPVGGKEIKKFINWMFCLQADMNKMMRFSGTHNSDPLSYVDCAKQRVGIGAHRLALYYFFVKCKDNPHVDEEFIVGIHDDLKASSTGAKGGSNESVDAIDQSVARTVASCTQKTKQQVLDSSRAAFESIITNLASKEAREAKEDLKKGRLTPDQEDHNQGDTTC
jgi:hypothetical protein